MTQEAPPLPRTPAAAREKLIKVFTDQGYSAWEVPGLRLTLLQYEANVPFQVATLLQDDVEVGFELRYPNLMTGTWRGCRCWKGPTEISQATFFGQAVVLACYLKSVNACSNTIR
jgi:hypothetical protein